MHIRIDYRNGGKRHVVYCSEYHKGKAQNPKCSSPHIMDADLLMQNVADVLKKIAEYSISNRAEFEALVKKSLAMPGEEKGAGCRRTVRTHNTNLKKRLAVYAEQYPDECCQTDTDPETGCMWSLILQRGVFLSV